MNYTNSVLAIVLALCLSATLVSAGQNSDGAGKSWARGAAFLDEDGDGFNDLAPDADGDGIPNGLDSDYVRPRDEVICSLAPWNQALATQQALRLLWGPYGLFAFQGLEHSSLPGSGSAFWEDISSYGGGFGPGSGAGISTGTDSGPGSRGAPGGPPDRGHRR